MAQDGVSALGAPTSFTLPTSVDTRQQEAYDDLSRLSFEAFDHAYIKNQIMAHKKAIWAFEQQAKESSDPQVKTFAMGMLPTLRRHLEEFKYLQERRTLAGHPGTRVTSPPSKNGARAVRSRPIFVFLFPAGFPAVE
ncbi:MAG: DUF4142 domain-containing protein [Armatimonas sp.]